MVTFIISTLTCIVFIILSVRYIKKLKREYTREKKILNAKAKEWNDYVDYLNGQSASEEEAFFIKKNFHKVNYL